MINEDNRLPAGYIRDPEEVATTAVALAGGADADATEVRAMQADYFVARMHMAVGYDLLVTTCRRLLDSRDDERVREANPVTPREAA